LMVQWHTDDFDERDPVTNHSFYNSRPLTYYVKREGRGRRQRLAGA